MSIEHSTPVVPSQKSDTEWSEGAYQAQLIEQRPTAENPVLFDIEDAVQLVSFEQIEGVELQGLVLGYFYTNEGNKINIILPNETSARKAGLDRGVEMKVPEWALTQPERGSDAEPLVLTEEQAVVADFAIENTTGIVRPDEDDDDISELRITPAELRAYHDAQRAAARVVTASKPALALDSATTHGNGSSQQSGPVRGLEQASYDDIKQSMADMVKGLSSLDQYYLEKYVEAGPARYNEQAVAVTKMSQELVQNNDLIQAYQALYEKRRTILGY